ncbi:hypothetical protein Y032_0389g523 [Ancylostoma ceylanicum]|uniref:Uncharacterized protein n=1 Tax=Ancylostoma ceylanicum TaxID=53326 RepID=A0A016RT99_9BILA|nr:hypothetical protein Y032_0389g523 [Ancylostoma ceylanicum]
MILVVLTFAIDTVPPVERAGLTRIMLAMILASQNDVRSGNMMSRRGFWVIMLHDFEVDHSSSEVSGLLWLENTFSTENENDLLVID